MHRLQTVLLCLCLVAQAAQQVFAAESNLQVTVDSGKYHVDGSPPSTIFMTEGETYVFHLDSSSNNLHPLRLSTTEDGSHGGGDEYSSGVATMPPGEAYVAAFGTPQPRSLVFQPEAPGTYFYYSAYTAGMGGRIVVQERSRVSAHEASRGEGEGRMHMAGLAATKERGSVSMSCRGEGG